MEILNTFAYNDSAWGALEFFSIVGAVVLIIIFINNITTNPRGWKNHIYCSLLLFVCVVGFLIGSHYNKLAYVNRYQVLIKDMSKFDYNKYKIVDQNGKIFTIEEIKK